MSQPHISFHKEMMASSTKQTTSQMEPPFSPGSSCSVGELLLRTAECLKALMQAPTAEAGLNESRYNVLAVLRRTTSGPCSQTELARELLQSESNLSTLLERMRKDGLISRVPSETDRRKALIGLTPAGSDALCRADQARARAARPIFHALDEQCETGLGETLGLLVEGLERTLGVARHGTTRLDAVDAAGRSGSIKSRGIDERTSGLAHSRQTALNRSEPSP